MLNNRIDSVVHPTDFGELDAMLDRTRKAIRLADYAQAEAHLREVQQRQDCDSAEYYNLLGAVCEGKKKLRLARKYYAKANAILSSYEPARLNLTRRGPGQVRLGDEDETVWYARLP